ncbi:hypothetical protein JMJ77_0005142, partial [Colletotrichum scovillei]
PTWAATTATSLLRFSEAWSVAASLAALLTALLHHFGLLSCKQQHGVQGDSAARVVAFSHSSATGPPQFTSKSPRPPRTYLRLLLHTYRQPIPCPLDDTTRPKRPPKTSRSTASSGLSQRSPEPCLAFPIQPPTRGRHSF